MKLREVPERAFGEITVKIMMMAKFSTSVGSLGLGGPIQGASLMRRGSISIMHRPSIQRPSRANMEDYLDPGASLTHQSTRRSEAERPCLSEDTLYQTGAKSPYLRGLCGR